MIFTYTNNHIKSIPDNRHYTVLLNNKISDIDLTDAAFIRLSEKDSSNVSALRYLYQNIDLLKDDMIGFSIDQTFFDKSITDIEKLINKGFRFVTTKPVNLGEYTFENHYSHYFSRKEIEITIAIIKSLYKEEYDGIISDILNSRYYMTPNIFVTEKDMFVKYCQFIFSVIDKIKDIFGSTYNQRFRYIIENIDSYNKEYIYDENFIFEIMKTEEHIWKFLHTIFVLKHFKGSEIAIQDVYSDKPNIDSESKNPLISIVIPAYNQSIYLRDCVDSIINQTFADWEVVIVDDGSPDNVREFAEYYQNIDSRIRFYHTENKGVGAARNFAVSKCSGKYVMNIDGDDLLSPYALEFYVKAYEKYPDAAIVKSGYVDFKDWRRNITEDFKSEYEIKELVNFEYKNMIFKNAYILHSACLCKREDYDKINGYDEIIEGYEDWELWLRLLNLYENPLIIESDIPLFYHRLRKESRNIDACRKHYDILISIIQKNRDIYSKFNDVDKIIDFIAEKKNLNK